MFFQATTTDPMPDNILLQEDVANWLRIEIAPNDFTVKNLINGAMSWAEKYTKQPLFERAYTAVVNGFPDGYLLGAAVSDIVISYSTSSGVYPLAVSDPISPLDPYQFSAYGLLSFRAQSVGSISGALTTITYKAGYDTNTLPGDIRDALLAYIEDRYDNRGNWVSERKTIAEKLLDNYVIINV